jgi:hypothetical protein
LVSDFLADVRERLALIKERAQKFYMKRFILEKLNKVERKEGSLVEI